MCVAGIERVYSGFSTDPFRLSRAGLLAQARTAVPQGHLRVPSLSNAPARRTSASAGVARDAEERPGLAGVAKGVRGGPSPPTTCARSARPLQP